MTRFDINAILSSTAFDVNGEKIGKVEQVFLDDNSGEPTFMTVNTGLFGAKENFVPVKGLRQDGDQVTVPFTKDVVKDAPKVDADEHLSPTEEDELYRYYETNQEHTGGTDRRRDVKDGDLDRDGHRGAAAGTGAAAGGVAGAAAGRDHDLRDGDRHGVSQDRARHEKDRDHHGLTDREHGRHDRDVADRDRHGDANSVTRHEERVNVGTEERATGKARLRKYVVTDHESVDVPVEREEVQVERTPIADGERTVGKDTIGEEQVDVTLHEERPVVDKETVAVEEVGLGKRTVEDTQRVDASVRKEQVDVETDAQRGDGLRDGRDGRLDGREGRDDLRDRDDRRR